MTNAVQKDEQANEEQIHAGIRSYAQTEAEFAALVERGRGSAKLGPNRDFAAIDDEIRRFLKTR